MSAITIENDLVHYEVLGRGRPVILVHGWLGSWRYWVPAMQQLSSKYRAYALDLWGFGDSGKEMKRYDFDSQVMLLDEFMEKMGITKAALIGHSLGAAVVARYAVKHPDRVPRMLVVSPPLFKMAPPAQPLTANPPPAERQLPSPPVGLTPPAVTPPLAPTPTPPALTPPPTATVTPPAVTPPAAPQQVPAIKLDEPMKALFDSPPAQTEADTMPLKSEEMKAKIKAALERRVQEGTIQAVEPAKPADPAKPPEAMQVVPPLSSVPSNSTPAPVVPKSPREAAVPPVDVSSFQLPDPLPSIPTMPKISYVPDAKEAQIQRANPLKEHLGSLDPIALLEKHVEAGADLEKLRVEVAKADKTAISTNIESFSGVDTLRDLRSLAIPAVAVYGMSDTLLPSPDQEMIQMLKEGRTTFNLIGMEDIRHFPMLENVAQFTRLLMDFLEVPDVMQLEIKKTWERRVR